MSGTIAGEILEYNECLSEGDRAICNLLSREIATQLPEAENKIWHAHPVWFLEGNPIVGYDKLKSGVRLMFWSGQTFEEMGLNERGLKFKDASVRYTRVDDIDLDSLKRWLGKSREVQWDYKNIVKRKGVLLRLK